MNFHSVVATALIASTALFVGCKGSGGPTVQASSDPWFTAASTGSQADLDSALRAGTNVNAKESRNWYSPLHVAGMAGNVDAVKFILANGGNVDALDEDARTPLMLSLWKGQGATSLALIDANANLELKGRDGRTALMFAAQYGQVDAIKAMVKKSVNLDAQNGNGATALIFAADRGQVEAARVLKEAGASTTIRDRAGRSAKDFATTKGYPEIVKLLTEK